MSRKQLGFTLIEVLLALAIIAIGLTALLKATGENISYSRRIKEKTIGHWVAMQGIAMVQADLIKLSSNQEATEMTKMLGQPWYWRISLLPSPIPNTQKIQIKVSRNQAGPFLDPVIGFKYIEPQS